jgi:hypothetical protein
MPRARIQYYEEPHCVAFIYHPPARWFAPLAFLWCLASGLAVGVGVAVGMTIVGVTNVSFRQALLGTALVVAAALYVVGYVLAQRGLRLRVTFDYARGALAVLPPHARGRRYAFDDVIEFRLSEQRGGCALLMETRSAGTVPLVAVPARCEAERTELPHLIERLDAHLNAAFAPEDDLPPAPTSATWSPLPVPARPSVRRSARDFPDDSDQ